MMSRTWCRIGEWVCGTRGWLTSRWARARMARVGRHLNIQVWWWKDVKAKVVVDGFFLFAGAQSQTFSKRRGGGYNNDEWIYCFPTERVVVYVHKYVYSWIVWAWTKVWNKTCVLLWHVRLRVHFGTGFLRIEFVGLINFPVDWIGHPPSIECQMVLVSHTQKQTN